MWRHQSVWRKGHFQNVPREWGNISENVCFLKTVLRVRACLWNSSHLTDPNLQGALSGVLLRRADWSSSMSQVSRALGLNISLDTLLLRCLAFFAVTSSDSPSRRVTLSNAVFRVPGAETVAKRKKKKNKGLQSAIKTRQEVCTLTPRSLFSHIVEKELRIGRVQPSASLRLIAPRTLEPTATLEKVSGQATSTRA